MDRTRLERATFLETRCLSAQVAQVVQLRATDFTLTDNFQLGDTWAVHWEDTLDTNGVRNLTDREGPTIALAGNPNDDAFEHLNTLFGAFGDANMHTHGVARTEVGKCFLTVLRSFDLIRGCTLMLAPDSAPVGVTEVRRGTLHKPNGPSTGDPSRTSFIRRFWVELRESIAMTRATSPTVYL